MTTTALARENVQSKGRRYLVEGRLAVVFVRGDQVRATCRGQGVVYKLGHDDDRWPGGWFCSCPARGRCAHLDHPVSQAWLRLHNAIAAGLVDVPDFVPEFDDDVGA